MPPGSFCISSCGVTRKHSGIPKDSCGTVVPGLILSERGGAKPGKTQPGHAWLTSAFLSPDAASLLNFLKWLCLPQFLSVLCMSHSFLPGSVSSCAPRFAWLLIPLLFNPFSSPAPPCPSAVLSCSAPDTFIPQQRFLCKLLVQTSDGCDIYRAPVLHSPVHGRHPGVTPGVAPEPPVDAGARSAVSLLHLTQPH